MTAKWHFAVVQKRCETDVPFYSPTEMQKIPQNYLVTERRASSGVLDSIHPSVVNYKKDYLVIVTHES